METHRLGNRIRAYRKLKGLTQKELAERLGVSVAVLGSVERGVRRPSSHLLNAIAAALQVPVEELTSGGKK
ncbi:helix-turn-helix domain-containing protein [Calditerricola satsumensis]|uniref:Transcriptional regulator n=1 Tax=Calditerricola satsumensis TaxID=373054 RepID=A0A8J3BDK5_9BACI|nr:helix-turn-helix transcriptional regulator [Calditerricola satsumensis]GGK07026.1 transcriptional regulator [Calditerricola satsumensis]